MLDIERLWGRAPGWFEELDEETQIRLFAWYRVTLEPQKSKKKPPTRGGRSR